MLNKTSFPQTHNTLLKKNERIHSRKDIGLLFSNKAYTITGPIITLKLARIEDVDGSSTSRKIFISVPKKKIKRAVDRNKIKRHIREIYRNCRDKGDNMTSNDILKYPFQGFDLDGDYIYIAESQSNTNTHISKIMNTFDLDHPNYHNEDHTNSNGLIKGKSARISLTISQSMRGNMGTDDSKEPEIEGIKIDSSATSPIMYIGFVQSSQRANVIKFTY